MFILFRAVVVLSIGRVGVFVASSQTGRHTDSHNMRWSEI
jgi:hypothetical protein